MKEEARDLLARADLSEGAVSRRVEINVESLLMRIFQRLEVEGNGGIHATKGYRIQMVCKSVNLAR